MNFQYIHEHPVHSRHNIWYRSTFSMKNSTISSLQATSIQSTSRYPPTSYVPLRPAVTPVTPLRSVTSRTRLRPVHTAQRPQISRRQNCEYARTVSMPWMLVDVQNDRSAKRRSSSRDASMSCISHMMKNWHEMQTIQIQCLMNDCVPGWKVFCINCTVFIFYSGLKHTGYDQSLSFRFRAKQFFFK